jgi:thiamine-phosphate pyrophosphorylase
MNQPSKTLPPLYLITPDPDTENGTDQFVHQLEKSLINGIRLVQFRAKNWEPAQYKELALKVVACCKQYDAICLLNADPELVIEVNAHGVHLDGTRLANYQHRPLDETKLISAACHTVEQLEKAEKLGVDMVTLSPVLATASHLGAEPLGWEKLALMTKKTRLPVYALGGMNAQLLKLAQENGAIGIAGIRAFWKD